MKNTATAASVRKAAKDHLEPASPRDLKSDPERVSTHRMDTSPVSALQERRQDLQLRASQLEQLLARMHQRIHAADAQYTERQALRWAAADFGHELQQVRELLAGLPPDPHGVTQPAIPGRSAPAE